MRPVILLCPLLAFCPLIPAICVGAATFQSDFSTDPTPQGWRAQGDPSLFHWNATDQLLEVTWDSSRGNTYFYHPLRTILSRQDDFRLSFDVRLDDLAIGTTPDKPYTFELAIGFLNFDQATNTGFLRGSGTDSPNLVEFDYFPDSGFGATISPTMISSNMEFVSSFNYPVELTLHEWFHVEMSYAASNQTLMSRLTHNGEEFASLEDAVVGTDFSDFRLDTVAVISYSDGGQDPMFAGSVLAHGVVDNFQVMVPEPPIANLTGGIADDRWQVQFDSQTNWIYHLEATTNFFEWSSVNTASGTGGPLTMRDDQTAGAHFYRVRADKP